MFSEKSNYNTNLSFFLAIFPWYTGWARKYIDLHQANLMQKQGCGSGWVSSESGSDIREKIGSGSDPRNKNGQKDKLIKIKQNCCTWNVNTEINPSCLKWHKLVRDTGIQAGYRHIVPIKVVSPENNANNRVGWLLEV